MHSWVYPQSRHTHYFPYGYHLCLTKAYIAEVFTSKESAVGRGCGRGQEKVLQ